MTGAGPIPTRPTPGRFARLRALDCTPLLAASLPVLTLLVLLPAQVYLANRSAVQVFLREVLLTTTLLAGSLILLLTGLLAILPRAIRHRLIVLLLGLSFLFWFHAYCLVWPYAVMDGADIPWEAYRGRGIIDALLWVVVLAPLLWFAPRVYPRVKPAFAALLLLQLVTLGVGAARAYVSPLDFFKHYHVESTRAFDFSPERNLIVVLLDEFQSDIFAEAVLAQAQYRKLFDGFTYFPDTIAGSNYTELALPAILTGSLYDNRRPRAEFMRTAYLEHSLPAVLKRAGVDVQLYPWAGFANESIYYHEEVASNFTRRPRSWPDRLVDVARLIDLGLFRCMPQFAKRYVHNGSAGRATEPLRRALARRPPGGATTAAATRPVEIGPILTLDHVFFDFTRDVITPASRITATTPGTAFKFYHLAGLHVPVKMKRDFTYGSFEYNRANYSEFAEAYAKIIGAFLRRLKAHGLYDQSMIIFLGDHGSGRTPELHVNPGPPRRTAELDRTAVSGDFQGDKARALPLLLVKRFGTTGAITTSRVPTSVIDLIPTVLSELDLPSRPRPALVGRDDFQGQSLYSLSENQPRVRYYGAMKWSAEKTDYVSPITLYKIEGPAWSDDSWSFVTTMEPPR